MLIVEALYLSFVFLYLCLQEKRAVALSIVGPNGSQKSVKKLLHFCYTTDQMD